MNASSRVSIRTDDLGTMAIQFMIDIGDNRNAFVEFRIVALSEDNGASDASDGDAGVDTDRLVLPLPQHADETLVF